MTKTSQLTVGQAVHVSTPVLSLRRTPYGAAEVVTQARLGEGALVREASGPWIRLALDFDGYEGWTRMDSLALGSWPPPGQPEAPIRQLFANLYAAPRVQAPLLLTVPLGAPLAMLGPASDGWRRVGLPGGREAWVQAGDIDSEGEAWSWQTPPELRRSLVQTARQLLGIPYRWGGTTPWGLDCSGLVQLVYRLHGLALARDAGEQAQDPRTFRVDRADLLPGDLLFFTNCGHVGLALSQWEFLHATTHLAPVVQVSPVDDPHWAALRDEVRRVRPAR
jgi:hypothetical protein